MTRTQPQGRMAGTPGTYALLLRCRRPARLRIGRLGVIRARPGFYVYVGSATFFDRFYECESMEYCFELP